MNSAYGMPCENLPLWRSNVAGCSPHILQVTWHEPAGCSCQVAVSAACMNFHCSRTDCVWCTPPSGCTTIWQNTRHYTLFVSSTESRRYLSCVDGSLNQHLTMKRERQRFSCPRSSLTTTTSWTSIWRDWHWLHTFLTLILDGITNFKHQPIYSQVNSSWNQQMTGWVHEPVGCTGKYSNFSSFWVFLGNPAHSLLRILNWVVDRIDESVRKLHIQNELQE
jgi:hypothetical protein